MEQFLDRPEPFALAVSLRTLVNHRLLRLRRNALCLGSRAFELFDLLLVLLPCACVAHRECLDSLLQVGTLCALPLRLGSRSLLGSLVSSEIPLELLAFRSFALHLRMRVGRPLLRLGDLTRCPRLRRPSGLFGIPPSLTQLDCKVCGFHAHAAERLLQLCMARGMRPLGLLPFRGLNPGVA
jgi:hypothetical protein